MENQEAEVSPDQRPTLCFIATLPTNTRPLYSLSLSETRVLGPWSKLLEFHLSGLATRSYEPNKETVMVKGRERKFIIRSRTCHGKKQSKPFNPSSAIFGVQI
jgi:hypothetical protein